MASYNGEVQYESIFCESEPKEDTGSFIHRLLKENNIKKNDRPLSRDEIDSLCTVTIDELKELRKIVFTRKESSTCSPGLNAELIQVKEGTNKDTKKNEEEKKKKSVMEGEEKEKKKVTYTVLDDCNPAKRLHHLRKKLKHVIELERKIASKEINPDKNQTAKVARKEELEMVVLELDIDIALGIRKLPLC